MHLLPFLSYLPNFERSDDVDTAVGDISEFILEPSSSLKVVVGINISRLYTSSYIFFSLSS